MAETERTSKPFLLTRSLAAPRELVFAALTRLEHLSRWMCPQGFEPIGCSLDLRPGGVYHYGMRSPDGFTMWGKWTFREIVAPGRLVVVVQFSDEAKGVTRAPFMQPWPLATLSTTTLTEQGPDRTLMSLDWRALDANEAEEQSFENGTASMTQGWNGTIDKLDALLASLQNRG